MKINYLRTTTPLGLPMLKGPSAQEAFQPISGLNDRTKDAPLAGDEALRGKKES